MNSKERVLRSIRHQEVDRIPCFYLGKTDINKALAGRFNIPQDQSESLLQRLAVDVRFTGPRIIQVPGEHRYGFSCGSIHSVLYNEPGAANIELKYPLEDVNTVDDLNKWCWPDPDWFDYKINEDSVKAWQDKAIVAYDMGIIFLYSMGIRGMEQIMMDMAGEPEMAHAIFKKIADFNLERIRRFIEANPNVIDIMGIGDDIAGQTGLFFSIDMWREFLKPHLQRMINLCNDYGVIPYFHGCGGFSALYKDFIEMGVTCTGRLQTEAKGNNFSEIKKEHGKDLCLWGAIDGQHIVIEKSPEHVREHVKELIRNNFDNTGYVAGPTHSFTEDTPIENIIAVYDFLKG